MADKAAREPAQALPPRPAVACQDAARAAEIAWAAVGNGEGGRAGVVGDSGVGKTVLLKFLVAEWLRRAPGAALVVDDKGPRQRFPGEPRQDVDDLGRRPLPDGARVVVFRGELVRGRGVDVQAVAHLAWRNATVRHRKTLLVVDEVEKAASYGMWKPAPRDPDGRPGVIYMREGFARGREVGLSMLWGAQTAQQAPVDCFDLSSTIAAFKSDGAALALLKRRRYLNGIDESVISSLPGELSPPGERGKFVLLVRGQPWNGAFYRVSPRLA